MKPSTGELAKRWYDVMHEQVLPVVLLARERLVQVRTKEDGTAVTPVDLEVQGIMVAAARELDDAIGVVAEETRPPAAMGHDYWVIDPIDGTAQYAEPGRREYCCVVARVVGGMPDFVCVLLPELGTASTPLIVTMCATHGVMIDGGAVLPRSGEIIGTNRASTTRSAGSQPRALEDRLEQVGFSLKTRTTSQTIDQLRVILDLQNLTDLDLPAFDFFIRERQWLWDGIAALTAAAILKDFLAVTLDGTSLLPVNPAWATGRRVDLMLFGTSDQVAQVREATRSGEG